MFHGSFTADVTGMRLCRCRCAAQQERACRSCFAPPVAMCPELSLRAAGCWRKGRSTWLSSLSNSLVAFCRRKYHMSFISTLCQNDRVCMWACFASCTQPFFVANRHKCLVCFCVLETVAGRLAETIVAWARGRRRHAAGQR